MQGLLAVLNDNWADAEPPKNLIDFVNGFRCRLFVAGGMAREKLQVSQKRMKKIQDRCTEHPEYSQETRILPLMPIVDSSTTVLILLPRRFWIRII